MERRLALQEYLQSQTEALEAEWRVYFQEPSSSAMKYPCLKYEIDRVRTKHADNKPYITLYGWQITMITEDSDDPAFDLFVDLPSCEHVRSFKADNLYHHIFNITF